MTHSGCALSCGTLIQKPTKAFQADKARRSGTLTNRENNEDDDAADRALVNEHGWEGYSLAGPMKRFAADMFGFTDEQLYGPSKFRNEPDPRWARPCPACEGDGNVEVMSAIFDCAECSGTGKINDNSPRRILQLMGEEFLRQMVHPDVLTMRARPDLERMLSDGRSVVINDARNDNDRDNLHEWLGAHRVDVRTERVKPITPANAWRLHASEQRLAKDDSLEHVIHQGDERWPFPSMPGKVRNMLHVLGLLRG